MRIDDLCQMYPNFHGIYRQHVEDAKFHTVERAEFKSLKERLMLVLHVSKIFQELVRRKRTELIQALLSGGNLLDALKLPPKSDKGRDSGKISW